MENKMQVFENEQFGQLRTVTIDGEPWFVGKDVAEALGHKNTKYALATHVCEEDKCVIQRSGFPTFEIPNRGLTIINESGLYSLIFSSQLDGAKQFKRWVTSEVLPSIRKHGAYMTDDLLEQAAINSDVAAKVAQALFEERSLNKKLTGQLKQAEAQLTRALPKAAYFDALVDAPGCTGIRLTAKELGVSQSMFTSYLVRKEYAYYDQKGKMHPVALAYRNGLFVVREFVAQNGHRGTQMLVTPKGKQVFLSEKAEIIGTA